MKSKVLPFFVAAMLLCIQLQAQVNIGGEPVSYNYEGKNILEPLSFVQTPPLDMAVIEAEDAQWEAERQAGMIKIGRRFGIEFTVDYGIHNAGVWTCLPDGSKLWRLGVECPEALSINLIFDQYHLPAGATVYIFSEDKRDKIGGFTNYNNQADNFFATDVVLSDKIIIEYYQPADADFDGELHLSTIVHGYRGPGEFTKYLGDSGPCQRNAKCPEGEGWEDQIRSVFALYSGGTEVCSGAMINNTANDGKPYALTANHCYSFKPNPSIWVFRFNWESPTCTPTTDSPYQTMSGSTLKMRTSTATSSTDCCLVELNQSIPDDYNVYFSGWSRSTTAPTSGMIIHHPSLDIKKITTSNNVYAVTQYVKGWRADFTVGGPCTEGGSSGSPLFDQNHRIIGQEYGGESYCGAPATKMFDVWGRLDQSWDGSSSSARLKDWLDPLGLDPETLDGYDPNVEIIVEAELLDVVIPEEIYYFDETITPQIVIKNNGTAPLTAATVSYTIDGENPVTKSWTGSIAVGDSTNITFDAITLTFGTHVFAASVTVADDTNPDNDSKSKDYEVKDCLISADDPLQEDFEEGSIPDCWQDMSASRANAWSVVTSGQNGQGNPVDPQSGTYNARFQSDNNGDMALLIAPPMDILDESMPNPVLSFWHAQAKYDNKQDKLRVYYKSTSKADWTLLKEYSDDIPAWKKENILLPNPSQVYWIAFEGISAGGSGVLLDNISVVEAEECASVQEIETEQTGNFVTISWVPPANADDVTGYVFYLNGVRITTVTDTFFSVRISQMPYEFCIVAKYDYAWCQESLPQCIDFDPVSILESSNDHHSKIYPNPATYSVTIQGEGLNRVEIYDLQGRKLAEYNNVKETLQINDLDKYDSGIYFIKMHSINNQSVTKRLTIIR